MDSTGDQSVPIWKRIVVALFGAMTVAFGLLFMGLSSKCDNSLSIALLVLGMGIVLSGSVIFYRGVAGEKRVVEAIWREMAGGKW